jgi:hypothetical protein
VRLLDDDGILELNDLRLGQANGKHILDAELRESLLVEESLLDLTDQTLSDLREIPRASMQIEGC